MKNTLLGIGFLIAGVGELQWAVTFYAGGDSPLALLLFAAGAGTILAALAGFFPQSRGWALWGGLAVAAVSHLAYFAATLSFGPLLILAAALAAAGLSLAAWAAKPPTKSGLLSTGLLVATAGAVVWTLSDWSENSTEFMVGNVFATIGWALAAWSTRASRASRA